MSFVCLIHAREFGSAEALGQHLRDAIHFHCVLHNKYFSTQRALDAHLASSAHVGLVPRGFLRCEIHDREFATQAARDKHFQSAAHRVTHRCEEHDKTFKTRDALLQHMASPAHASEESEDEFDPSQLEAPVDTPGTWVWREDFRFDKSFGYYSCTHCSRFWFSAHAWRQYHQECQGCNTSNYPLCMWKNDRTEPGRSKDGTLDGNHDQARCEACRRGRCLAAQEYVVSGAAVADLDDWLYD